MKKNEKIMIGILLLILLVIVAISIATKAEFKQDIGKNDTQIDKEQYNLQEEYSLENAIEEGYFIITNNKIYNKDKLERFIENTGINSKNRIEDSIKIMQVTKEGDPIIIELSYKIKDETYLLSGKPVNKTTYILKVDNTKDRFASEEDRKVIINEDIPGNIYGIVEEKNGEITNINLALYAEICYVDSNTKIYETINICSYSNNLEKEQNEFFYGKVIESHQNYILVEPNEGENIRKSADKIAIDLGKYSDVIYKVGTNVKITYKGYIMETYPAKVDVVNIELKSTEDFEIRFYDKHPENNVKINKILDKSETDKYNYNIYSYDGSVNIFINGEEISLKKALLENKITMNEIIVKANKDLKDKKINGDIYKDGGTMIYKYENYTIIKLHTLDGNRDVYIGTTDMNLNNIK